MSDDNLNVNRNVQDELKEKTERLESSESDEDDIEDSSVVNKDSKFYKKLYTFLASRGKYINLLIKCKSEDVSKGNLRNVKSRYASNLKLNNRKEEKEEKEKAINLLKNIIKNEYPKRSDKQIDLYLTEIINDPPKENCLLHKIFYQKDEQKDLFIKHNIICYLLNFMDNQTLMKLKECSHIDNIIVSLYLRKILYSLPFKDGDIKVNINYWKNVVNYFFVKACILKPINRNNYSLITNELEKNQSFCVINKESMVSKIFISVDYFNTNNITCCNHNNPLPHTCDPKNKIEGISYFKTENITMIDFIKEYYQRIKIIDDEIIWNTCYFRKSPEFLTLLLLEYFKCMASVVHNYNGNFIFSKTEYMVNCGYQMYHRIWLQIFYEYGQESVHKTNVLQKNEKNKYIQASEFNKNNGVPNFDKFGNKTNINTVENNTSANNKNVKKISPNSSHYKTLYLTIADHYRWDA
ncbi:conserved protein, unknown function [Hepatocystis sp. ex Piliocolobus tephrosceles]|nr:conserved protein, unknown function [Hepatocystis sp. ex Piliocolobus tephrosceles]